MTTTAEPQVERAPEQEGVVYRALAEPVTVPEDGDGLTFEGYAAVFNRTAHINDHLGEYDEMLLPGTFKRSISRRTPLFFYQHGKHPLFGPYPLGRIETLREDDYGLFVRARLTDTPFTKPIRDAIQNRAITGMSVAMNAGGAGVTWSQGPNGRLRTVRRADVFELGPVTGEAYTDTTAVVRSILGGIEDEYPDAFDGLYDERLADFQQRAVELAATDPGPLAEPAPAAPLAEPAVEPAVERAPMTTAERQAYLRRIELQRRGIQV